MYGTESDELFSSLEHIGVDSYTKRLIGQKNELETLLNSGVLGDDDEFTELTKKDIERETIAVMESECPHYQRAVLVTGRIIRAYYDEIKEKFDTEIVEMNHSVVMSWGFTTMDMVAEGETEERRVVGHLFLLDQLPAQRDTPALVDYVPRLYGFAPIGEVDIEYEAPDHINTESLEQHIPELLETVDEIIGDNQDECDVMMRLGMMTIGHDQDIPTDVLAKLLTYVKARLGFDTQVPYEVVIQGLFYEGDTDLLENAKVKYYRDNPGMLIAYPETLSLTSYPKMIDKKVVLSSARHWCVGMRVLGVTPDDPDLFFTVPARNIRAMHSIRRIANNQ